MEAGQGMVEKPSKGAISEEDVVTSDPTLSPRVQIYLRVNHF